MTLVINLAKKAKIPFKVHEYAHDPANEAYGL
jgi:Cys-tRNA(Pro)/Cys-tRNA(Cys) deacylase